MTVTTVPFTAALSFALGALLTGLSVGAEIMRRDPTRDVWPFGGVIAGVVIIGLGVAEVMRRHHCGCKISNAAAKARKE